MIHTDDRTAAELRRVARHEAGHCLVLHLLGGRIYLVSINAQGDLWGTVDYRTPDDPRDELTGALAGELAASRGGCELRGKDLECARRCLGRLGESPGGPAWLGAEARAEGLLTAHADALDALAEQLLRKKEMDGFTVHAFLDALLTPDQSEGWEERLGLARYHAGYALAVEYCRIEVRSVELSYSEVKRQYTGRSRLGLATGDLDAARAWAPMVGNLSEWQNKGDASDNYFNECHARDRKGIISAVAFYERHGHKIEWLARRLAKRLKLSREDVQQAVVMTREHPYPE